LAGARQPRDCQGTDPKTAIVSCRNRRPCAADAVARPWVARFGGGPAAYNLGDHAQDSGAQMRSQPLTCTGNVMFAQCCPSPVRIKSNQTNGKNLKSLLDGKIIISLALVAGVLALASQGRGATGAGNAACGAAQTNSNIITPPCDGTNTTEQCKVIRVSPHPTSCAFGARSDGHWCQDKASGTNCIVSGTAVADLGRCQGGACALDGSSITYRLNIPSICGSGVDFSICPAPGS